MYMKTLRLDVARPCNRSQKLSFLTEPPDDKKLSVKICLGKVWGEQISSQTAPQDVREDKHSMRNSIRISLFGVLLVVALACVAPAALAGNVHMALDDPPSNNIMDNVYVGPYNATNTDNGTAMQVICDDFRDESNSNSYSYTQVSFSNLGSSLGSTLWGSTLLRQGDSQNYIMGLYEQAAWLAEGMLSLSAGQQAYYAFALWAVFDPADVLTYLRSFGDVNACNAIFGGHQNCSSSSIAQAGGILYSAQQNYMNGNYSNLVILTPVGCTLTGCQEQEFFMVAPEGGSALLYLLLAGVVCFGIVRQSRRNGQAVTSA